MDSGKHIPRDLVQTLSRMTDPIAVHDDRTCLFANPALLELFGYVREEDLVGLPMGEILSPWPAGPPRLGRRQAIGRRKTNPPLDLDVMTLPCLADGNILYQCVLRNVTELRTWEDKLLQAERLAAMGKVAGEIAHEINNPLGGILLYANLIREDIPADTPAGANLEKIIKLATRCRIIAKGLLNFSRSPAEAFAHVDLNQVIREMFSMVEDHRMFREVIVEMRLAGDLPHLMADPGQMEQMVLNLVTNAGEAIQGAGHVLIETRFLNTPAPTVVFSVQDTGPGIPDEVLPRIFEPFFTTKRPGKGTGLGLAITHGIVQRHGGRISVRSVRGKGTMFEVSLPVGRGR